MQQQMQAAQWSEMAQNQMQYLPQGLHSHSQIGIFSPEQMLYREQDHRSGEILAKLAAQEAKLAEHTAKLAALSEANTTLMEMVGELLKRSASPEPSKRRMPEHSFRAMVSGWNPDQ